MIESHLDTETSKSARPVPIFDVFDWKWRRVMLTTTVVILLLGVTYVALSLQTVQMNRLSGRLRFGRYVENLEPGLHLIWYGIDSVLHVTKNTIESDMPDSPENIYHGDPTAKKADGSPGDGVVPEEKTPAIRVIFAEKVIKEPIDVKVTKGDKEIVLGTIFPENSLLKPQAAEIEFSYGFTVKNLETFYTITGGVDNAIRNMNDHAHAGFTNRLQRLSLAEATLMLDYISLEVLNDLQTLSSTWGIEVGFVRLKTLGLSHEYNSTRTGTASAVEVAKQTVITAESKRTEGIKLGEAEASKERNMLFARAEGFQRTAEIASTPGGQFAMVNDTMRQGMKQGTLIVPQDNLFGIAAGIAKIVDKNQGTTTVAPAPTQAQATVIIPTSTTPTQPKSSDKSRGQKGKDRK